MKLRLVSLGSFLGLWALLIVARLYQIQIEQHEHYAEKARRQHERIIQVAGPRGRILDSRGRLLAISLMATSVFAVPSEIRDPKATVRNLVSRLPGLDQASLEKRIQSEKEFVWVARGVDPPVAKAIKDLELSGVYFFPEAKRYYPMREEASQILGLVGTSQRGVAGLELFYDQQLSGESVGYKVFRDVMRTTFQLKSSSEPKAGKDLHLTLDSSIQYFAEQALEAAVQTFRVQSASVVLLSPADGSVLAMASYPGFDLNNVGESPPIYQRIRLTRDLYSPGSLFLAVAAAASLEVGLQKPGDFRGFEAGKSIEGAKAMLDGLSQSQALSTHIRDLGFGQMTHVDLPGERAGLFEPPDVRNAGPAAEKSSPYSSLATTPLQLAVALTALVNGGFRVSPHLLQGTAPSSPRVFSSQTIGAFRPFWREERLRGQGSGPLRNEYSLAGIAGRAVGPLDGPSDPTIVDTYFGFAPVSKPIFTGLVLVDGVSLGVEKHGMAVAVLRQIAYNTSRYLRIRPEPVSSGLWPGQTFAH